MIGTSPKQQESLRKHLRRCNNLLLLFLQNPFAALEGLWGYLNYVPTSDSALGLMLTYEGGLWQGSSSPKSPSLLHRRSKHVDRALGRKPPSV